MQLHCPQDVALTPISYQCLLSHPLTLLVSFPEVSDFLSEGWKYSERGWQSEGGGCMENGREGSLIINKKVSTLPVQSLGTLGEENLPHQKKPYITEDSTDHYITVSMQSLTNICAPVNCKCNSNKERKRCIYYNIVIMNNFQQDKFQRSPLFSIKMQDCQ